jgi:hypothetical protein
MSSGAFDSDVAADAERTGIILDRLAGELERAVAESPGALAELREDARLFVRCIEPYVAGELADLEPIAEGISIVDDPGLMAGAMRVVADRFLDLAERLGRPEPGEDPS